MAGFSETYREYHRWKTQDRTPEQFEAHQKFQKLDDLLWDLQEDTILSDSEKWLKVKEFYESIGN